MRTKHFFLIPILAVLFFPFSNISAQPWMRGGNPAVGVSFMGSNSSNNEAVRFGTFGISRMFIQNNTGPTAGFIGIGNGFFTPAFRLDVKDNINLTPTVFGDGYRLNSFTVLQTPGIENTFVGRGTGANFTGSFLGENTFVGFNAGGSMVGSINGGDRNTFVGRAAGFSMVNGRYNTFLGCDAGLNLVTGNANTFVGEHSGFQQVAGSNNTYLGSHSGQGNVNSTGNNNTFLGMDCGPDNVNGNSNTYTGVMAGNNCNTGNENCFYGLWAGLFTIGGSGNVFMGARADRFNRNGNNNTFIGTDAGVFGAAAFWNLDNVSGFGFNAIARASNTMILGNNSVYVGIGLSEDLYANGPQNKLEIDAGLSSNPLSPTDPSPNGLPGESGLTFRDLHLGNTASAVNGFALSVDQFGKVILVPAGGDGFGTCPTPTVLSADAGIQFNNKNIYFDGQGSTGNNMGIGYACSSPLGARVDILRSLGTPHVPIPIALRVQNTDIASLGTSIAIQGNAASVNKINIGGDFKASLGNSNIAGNFISNIPTGAVTNTGGFFEASNGQTDNYAGKFYANGSTGTNYAVWAESLPAPLNGLGPHFAGHFNGDVVVTGYMGNPSDQMFKQNIDSISNVFGIIDQLSPLTYYYDTLGFPKIAFSGKKQYGFKAQDVEIILPELVGIAVQPAEYDSLGNETVPAFSYKTLNNQAFTAILTKGLKEEHARNNYLAAELDSMRTVMADMQSQINGCCSSNERTQNSNAQSQEVTLTSGKAILYQNSPNPAGTETDINYYLPENAINAEMVFFDMSGNEIQRVVIQNKGNAKLHVSTQDLASGVYAYSLIVDGHVVSTLQMIKAK